MSFYPKDFPKCQTSATLKNSQKASYPETLLQYFLPAPLLALKVKDKESQIREIVCPLLPRRLLIYNLNTWPSLRSSDFLTAKIDTLITSFSLSQGDLLDKRSSDLETFEPLNPLLEENYSEVFLRDKTNQQQSDRFLERQPSDPERAKPLNPLLEDGFSQQLLRDKSGDRETGQVQNYLQPNKSKKSSTNKPQNYSRRKKTGKRKAGEGSGYIKTIDRIKSGKQYVEYWYQWEIWSNGKQVKSGTTYIARNKLSRCRAMETNKEKVSKILRYLRTNKKKKK